MPKFWCSDIFINDGDSVYGVCVTMRSDALLISKVNLHLKIL